MQQTHSSHAVGGMQMGKRGTGIACRNYTPNKISNFTLIQNTPNSQAFQILGKFILGLSNFPIKKLRRYKNLILPFVVFLQHSHHFLKYSDFFAFISYLFLRYCIHRKDGNKLFRFSFLTLFL